MPASEYCNDNNVCFTLADYDAMRANLATLIAQCTGEVLCSSAADCNVGESCNPGQYPTSWSLSLDLGVCV